MKLRNKKTGGLANILGEQDFFRVYTDAGWSDYNSLAELNEEWEDYKPTEPLIKDEKTRKVVLAWAEINHYKKCIVRVYDYDRMGICIEEGVTSFVSCDTQLGITFFDLNLDNLETEKPYTIAELCGEEEEEWVTD